MRQWAAYFSLLGGRQALNAWSIAVVIPVIFGLAMLSGWGPLRDDSAATHLLPTVLAHATLAVVTLLIWWLAYLRPQRTPAAWVTLVFFAFIGVIRIPLIDAFYLMVGVEPLDAQPARLALSAVLVIELFVVMGVVVELVSRSTHARRELTRAEQAIRSLRVDNQATRKFWKDDVLSAVQSRLDQLLVPWRVNPPSRSSDVADALDEIVTQVVRPLSHEAGRAEPPQAPLGDVDSMGSSEEARAMDLRWNTLEPTSGVTMLVASAPVALLYTIERFGWGIEIAVGALGLVILGLGLWGLRALVSAIPLHTFLGRLLTIGGGLVVLGMLSTSGLVMLGQSLGSPVSFIWGAPFLIVFLGIGVSIADHLIGVTLEREQQASDALAQLASDTAEWERSHRDVARETASLLHSGVQAELVAWSAVFRSPDFTDEQISVAVAEMESRIDALFEPGPATDALAPEAELGSLVTVWSAARPIEWHVAESLWPGFRDNPHVFARLITVISEGLSNAVRHGRPGPIDLELVEDETTGFRLTMANPGVLRPPLPGAVGGLGTETIAQCSDRSEVVQDGGRVKLTASFRWRG